MSSVHLLLDTAETVGEPRTGPRRFWTGREEMILRNGYPEDGLAGCLEKLPGRSAQAIYEHARKLGLKSPREAKPTRRPRLESSEHIDALIRRTCLNNPESGAIKRLAQTINRSRQWIRDQAIRLGCAVPRFKAPPWTAEEIEIIAESPHLGPLQLQRRLRSAGFQRTGVAIVSKLGLLGVSTIDPDHYTASGLAKLFGVDNKVVTGWILKGWLGAERRGTVRTDQQGGDQWWIHRSRVRRFVVDNVAAIDIRKLDKFWFVDLMADRTSSPAVSAAEERLPIHPSPEPGKLVLHPERRRVTAGGGTVILTGLEYALLELLLSREGHVVSRDMLMSHAYGDEAHPGIRIIGVVVCRLRGKLKRIGAVCSIGTERGVGFVFSRQPIADLLVVSMRTALKQNDRHPGLALNG
jgi:DNA-binding winged helix-turn-helix (wHTH) protein